MSNNENNVDAPGSLSEEDWARLIMRIETGKCTPFLGAGVNHKLLPLGATIAREWAVLYQFPLLESHDLARVAQFLALTKERVFPKELMQTLFQEKMTNLFASESPPDFTAPYHPLGILGALPLPIYITTNYDDFMYRALRANKKKARVELCTWTPFLQKKGGAVKYPNPDDYSEPVPPLELFTFAESEFNSSRVFVPTKDDRVVYHLHGHYSLVESMVLTENDYYDFLVHMSKDPKLLPDRITTALTGASLLFMGYSLADPNFRVLFRGLIHPMAENRRLSVSIQLRPSDLPEPDLKSALKFLEKYFEDLYIKVFWGTAEEFAAELWRRWNERKGSTN